jgi:hypothetical protein
MASCALTAAAFGRFLMRAIRDVWSYAGVDLLILMGAARDLIVNRRLHPVYLYGLPLLMVEQIAMMSVSLKSWPAWMKVAHRILEVEVSWTSQQCRGRPTLCKKPQRMATFGSKFVPSSRVALRP